MEEDMKLIKEYYDIHLRKKLEKEAKAAAMQSS